jgi:transcriptional regulator with XRE-family HTH domain
MINIGERIRTIRESKGLTQKLAAERAGIDQPRWSRFETEGRIPRLDSLLKIASSLEIDVSELLIIFNKSKES